MVSPFLRDVPPSCPILEAVLLVRKPEREASMIVINVHVWVEPEHVEQFKEATSENAGFSVREPGVARFDVLQHQDDPTRFLMVEVYRTAEAPAAHKDTAHYQKWRDAVEPMMAQPRSSDKYQNVFPADEDW
jgi:quinol monooxygenase YgiN